MAVIVVQTFDDAIKVVAKTAADILAVARDPVLAKQLQILAVSGVKDHFVQGAGPDGVPWAPLQLRSGKPLRDTGLLMAATTARAQATATGITVELHNNKVQARLQNEGGIVTPKKAKYLAVPLTQAARRAGTPRSMQLHPRFRRGAQAGLLVDNRGVPQFALVKMVRVPKRKFMGFSQKMLAKCEQAVQTRARQVVQGN